MRRTSQAVKADVRRRKPERGGGLSSRQGTSNAGWSAHTAMTTFPAGVAAIPERIVNRCAVTVEPRQPCGGWIWQV